MPLLKSLPNPKKGITALKRKNTNPNAWDSDSDYVADYWEIYNYYTDPTKSDSDDDGAPDWFEISYMGYDTDADGDGLPNPWDWDSDGDLIADGKEIEINPETGDVNIITNPLIYTNLNMTDKEDYDAVAVARSDEFNIEVTVVVDYAESGEKPIITIKEATRANAVPIIEVQTTEGEKRAEMRYLYNDTGLSQEEEMALALYRNDPEKGWIIGEDCGVDTINNIVWVRTSNPDYDFEVRDSRDYDSDGDGLSDYYERNTYHTVFYDDVEHGNLGWKTGYTAKWEIREQSGNHYWYIGTDIAYGRGIALESRKFSLPESQWAVLSFRYQSNLRHPG